MSTLFEKFITDLQLPKEIVDKLCIKRNDEELKIFALSLPTLKYPDTYILAGRLFLYVNIKCCPETIEEYVDILQGLLRDEIKEYMMKNAGKINKLLKETYYYNFKNHNILSASSCVNYLLKISHDEAPIETPCQLILRQAIQFYYNDSFEEVEQCYYDMVESKYIHASPTMFNAGTRKNQMASCFLITLGDNLESLLYTGAGDVGLISKAQGGIGISMNAIRHSNISNTGKSSGVLPFGKIYDSTISCVNQGGKRNGAMTITLNDWHIDFFDFIQSRDNYTQNGIRFKQANICAFVSRLFMDRVKKDQKWTLFCPAKAKHNDKTLLGTYGHDFEELYVFLEKEAIKRKEIFDELDADIKVMEKEINSSTPNKKFINDYHKKRISRITFRKNLIDYKVMDARKIYNTLCDMNIKSGMPYVVYRDPVNLKNNMSNIGSTEGLNLCVTPETLVLTDNGNIPIIELCDKEVNVWNGEEFSNVVVKKTGSDQKILKISFSDGSLLECTPYHKFFIQTSSGKTELVESKDLEKDMELLKCSYPIIDKGKDIEEAYESGFFVGEGVDCRPNSEDMKSGNYTQLYLNIEDNIPLGNSLKSKMEWLSGYADANGVLINEPVQFLQIFFMDRDFLIGVKNMLQTCGCNPKVSVNPTDDTYFLMISCADLQLLSNNGFKTYRLNFEKRDVQRESRHFVSVESIIDLGRISDTYCFTEHKRNVGIFNGVLTSQCLEITEPSTPDAISSCNLGHINLKAFVRNQDYDIGDENLKDFYDFEGLGKAAASLTKNINKVIDYNYYPLDERDEKGNVIKRGKISIPNFQNRPLGIGVSGLAEVFALLKLPYDHPLSFKLNKMIFAAMYYHSLKQSWLLAKKEGCYENFRTGTSKVYNNGKWEILKGSLMSNGYLQFDLWQAEAEYLKSKGELNEKIYNMEDNKPIDPWEWGMDKEEDNWNLMKERIVTDGIRNAMLLALMPTASSAQMLQNAETTEAHQTLVYSRKLVHGNYTAFSEPFVADMQNLGLWTKEMIDFIMMANGSICEIDKFVCDNRDYFSSNLYTEEGKMKQKTLDDILKLKNLHRGMYEISQKDTMQMARQRGIYICQSQSLNIYLGEPDIKKVKAVHSYSNALGLKTGMYYLRQNPASQTDRFTVDIKIQEYHKNLNKRSKMICTDEVCLMCQ